MFRITVFFQFSSEISLWTCNRAQDTVLMEVDMLLWAADLTACVSVLTCSWNLRLQHEMACSSSLERDTHFCQWSCEMEMLCTRYGTNPFTPKFTSTVMPSIPDFSSLFQVVLFSLLFSPFTWEVCVLQLIVFEQAQKFTCWKWRKEQNKLEMSTLTSSCPVQAPGILMEPAKIS